MGALTGPLHRRAAGASALLWLLLPLPGLLGLWVPADAQQRSDFLCNCSCSSRVVARMFFCDQDGPCCASPCQPRGPDIGSLQTEAEEAVEAGRAAALACTNASLTRDSQLEFAHPVTRGTPEYHHGVSSQPLGVDGFVRSVTDRCLATSVASALVAGSNLTARDAGRQLLALRVNSSLPNPWLTPVCNASARYRTFDGSCNNLRFPRWGQSGSQFLRLLCPSYADGLYAPPRAHDGGALPSARLVRRLLIPNTPPKHGDAHLLTLLTMQWGQLLAHDSALTADFMGVNGFSVECCTINNSTPTHRSPLPANETASSCLPVDGPGQYCLSVVRGNSSFVSAEGFVGPGEQDNAVNSYLDASFVYGNSEATARSLREGQGGRLNTSGNNWLLRSANPGVDCDPRNNSNLCFVAGDVRVNQNTQLTSLQILFQREHNRVAGELARVNPQWGDDRLYDETRRVVIAEYQHITYDRLVPLYVGFVTARRFNLVPDHFCQYDTNGYDPTMDATTINEFATASYRVFHGIAQSILKLYGRAGGCPVGKLRMNDWMDTPIAVVEPPQRLDQLLLGLSTQPMQKASRWLTDALAEHMFQTDADPGQDLGAFDIQRGRDHGLPSYCEFKRKLTGRCCRRWRDLEDHFDPEVIQRMRTVYRSPRDVDLYVGLYLERPNGFALTGSSAVAINLEQFLRWKYGDRFFYEFGGQTGSFTVAQLCEIKKATAARLFCDNGDNITSVQRDLFFQPHFLTNPVIGCQYIPAINFSSWKE